MNDQTAIITGEITAELNEARRQNDQLIQQLTRIGQQNADLEKQQFDVLAQECQALKLENAAFKDQNEELLGEREWMREKLDATEANYEQALRKYEENKQILQEILALVQKNHKEVVTKFKDEASLLNQLMNHQNTIFDKLSQPLFEDDFSFSENGSQRPNSVAFDSSSNRISFEDSLSRRQSVQDGSSQRSTSVFSSFSTNEGIDIEKLNDPRNSYRSIGNKNLKN